jgi:hypothetical protein
MIKVMLRACNAFTFESQRVHQPYRPGLYPPHNQTLSKPYALRRFLRASQAFPCAKQDLSSSNLEFFTGSYSATTIHAFKLKNLKHVEP